MAGFLQLLKENLNYRYTWHLPKDRTWTYDGQLNMVRNDLVSKIKADVEIMNSLLGAAAAPGEQTEATA